MLNASGMLGNIDRTPAAPGSPIIHFRSENIPDSPTSWTNSGSGGVTYNATATGSPIQGDTYYGFRSIRFPLASDYLTIANEYVLPNASISGFVVKFRTYEEDGSYSVGISALGQKSSTGGGGSSLQAYLTVSSGSKSGYVYAFDQAGNADGQLHFDPTSSGYFLRVIVDRTAADVATLYINGSGGYQGLDSLVGPIRLGRIGSNYGSGSTNGHVSLFEAIVYSTRSVSVTELDTWMKEKFGM